MNSSETLFQYYQSILPEPESWSSVVNDALPITGWVNPLKTTFDQLVDYLAADGFKILPMGWHPLGFRVAEAPYALGRHWTFRTGLIHIQEEVSMLAGQVLQVQSGQRVLDLCSAPGNKSVQLAIQLDPQGTLIANDKNYSRMRALGQMIVRLGLINITTSIYDGTQFPEDTEGFDAVLVDAPCSCQGTFRKNFNKVITLKPDYSRRLSSTQELLLRKAVARTKLGGRILYSTCTFAPEENEQVVDRVLKRFPGELRVLPIKVENFKISPGLTQWQGQVFSDSLHDTLRVWPHLNNTGGFYLALLEKSGETKVSGASDKAPLTSVEVAEPYVEELMNRFGFPQAIFKEVVFLENGNKGFHAASQGQCLSDEIKSDATGLFFIKTQIRHPKLSSGAAMRWGGLATRHFIVLDETQRNAYMAREDLILNEPQITVCTSMGYVIVKYKTVVLGVGLYFPSDDAHGPYLRSLFPKRL